MKNGMIHGGFPRQFPSELFWQSHVPMTQEAALEAARYIWSGAYSVEPGVDLDLTGKKILEIGCGRGEVAQAFAKMGATVVAVDYDHSCIEYAKDHMDQDVENLTYLEADTSSADFTSKIGFSQYFDFAFCHYTGWGYFGLNDIVETLHNVRECLKVGSFFVLDSFGGDAVIERFNPDLSLERKTPDGSWTVENKGSLHHLDGDHEVSRIDQCIRYISPDGVSSADYHTTFEILTDGVYQELANIALLDIVDRKFFSASEGRTTKGTGRILYKMERRPIRGFPYDLFSWYPTLTEFIKEDKKLSDPLIIDGKYLTLQDFLDTSVRMRIALNAHSLIKEKTVAVILPRSWAWPVAFHSISSSEGIFVPIDPDLPGDRMKEILKDLAPSAVVCFSEFSDTFKSRFDGEICDVQRMYGAGPDFESLMVFHTNEVAKHGSGLNHIIYTSGSSGKPKAVLLELRGLIKVASAQKSLLPEEGNFLWSINPSFDASLSDVLCGLTDRRVLQIYRGPMTDIKSFKKAILEADIADIPPSLLRICADEITQLKGLVFGGEKASPDAVKKLKGIEFGFQAYGPTEASVCAMVAKPTADWKEGTLGVPLIADTIILKSGDTWYHVEAKGNYCPNEVNLFAAPDVNPITSVLEGEIFIRGRQVALGYKDPTEEQAKTFGSFFGSKLYQTGDIARFKDGILSWIGRTDRQVKIRGKMMCPEESEVKASQLCPQSDFHVVVESEKIYLFHTGNIADDFADRIVDKLGATFRIKEIRKVEKFPLTGNGKIDSNELMRMSHNA